MTKPISRAELSWLFVACLWLAGPFVWAQPSHIYRANATTLHLQGQGLVQEGRLPEAIQLYQRAIQYNPFATQTASIYNSLGLAYRMVQRPELAMVSFMFATRIQPGFGPYYDNLVATWRDAGRLPDARVQLEQITGASPDDGTAWYLLGLVAQSQNDPDTRDAAWQRFIQLEPNSALRKGVCTVIQGC